MISAVLLAICVFSVPVLSAADLRGPAFHKLTSHLAGGNALPLPTVDEKEPPTVAILLFDGVQIIDYSGPWEVFGQAGFKVHTVAEKREPLTTAFGQKVVADYTFDDSPRADILLLPGGGGTRKAVDNPRLIKWIQDNARSATHVMSVCTGAFLLAKAGLLDGLTATTFHTAIDRLVAAAPKATVVYDQRYVDNGKVITTAGLSSGIDGALHLVAKIAGEGQARAVALGLEYRWTPDSKYARAAFADRYLPAFNDLDGNALSMDGDSEHWEVKYLITKPSSLEGVLDVTQKELVTNTPHKNSAVTVTRTKKNSDQAEIKWTFTDDLGRAWVGSGIVAMEQNAKVTLALRLRRDK